MRSGHSDPEIRGGGGAQINLTIRPCLVNVFLNQYCQVTSNITKGYSCGQLLRISLVGPARESSLFDHLINPLLPKLARSRML